MSETPPPGFTPKKEPTEISSADLRLNQSDIILRTRYAKERFLISLRGEPSAGLVSVEDLARLIAMEQLEDPKKDITQ